MKILIKCLIIADDLITPVYVAPTRSPTTFKPKGYINKDNIPIRPSCDDEEDCEEGSGDPGTTEEIFVTSATGGCPIPEIHSMYLPTLYWFQFFNFPSPF